MTKTAKTESRVEPLVDIKEVARWLGVCERMVRYLSRRRGLPKRRLSHRCVRYRMTEVSAWLDRQQVAN